MTIAARIEKLLGMLYNKATDPVFRALIADSAGVENPTISDPRDFNCGAVAEMLEWNRRLAAGLEKQLDISQASGIWLDYAIHVHVGLPRFSGETDSQYVERISEYLIGPKCSPGAIVAFFRRYSPGGEPFIYEGESDSAFADASFAGEYTGFWLADGSAYVFPAIACGSDSQAFYFQLFLYGTPAADIAAVIEAINRYKMAGVEAQVYIQ